jgi:hypothetical protein
MQHRPVDFTESDTTVALSSPFVPQEIKDELIVIRNRRVNEILNHTDAVINLTDYQ